MPTYDGTGTAPADDVGDDAGACPPIVLRYRIYVEKNFAELFGDPPISVET